MKLKSSDGEYSSDDSDSVISPQRLAKQDQTYFSIQKINLSLNDSSTADEDEHNDIGDAEDDGDDENDSDDILFELENESEPGSNHQLLLMDIDDEMMMMRHKLNNDSNNKNGGGGGGGGSSAPPPPTLPTTIEIAHVPTTTTAATAAMINDTTTTDKHKNDNTTTRSNNESNCLVNDSMETDGDDDDFSDNTTADSNNTSNTTTASNDKHEHHESVVVAQKHAHHSRFMLRLIDRITTDRETRNELKNDLKLFDHHMSSLKKTKWRDAETKFVSKYVTIAQKLDPMSFTSLRMMDDADTEDVLSGKMNVALLKQYLSILLGRSIKSLYSEWDKHLSKVEGEYPSKFIQHGTLLQDAFQTGKLQNLIDKNTLKSPKTVDATHATGAFQMLQKLLVQYQRRHKLEIGAESTLEEPSYDDIAATARQLMKNLDNLEKGFQEELSILLQRCKGIEQ